MTQEPQKHRNSSKSLIRKFSPLQSFLFEKAIHQLEYFYFLFHAIKISGTYIIKYRILQLFLLK